MTKKPESRAFNSEYENITNYGSSNYKYIEDCLSTESSTEDFNHSFAAQQKNWLNFTVRKISIRTWASFNAKLLYYNFTTGLSPALEHDNVAERESAIKRRIAIPVF